MAYNQYFKQMKTGISLTMKRFDIPGIAISVVDGDSVLFSQGFGYTSQHRTYPVTRNTRFGIQSISKTYTAFGFMLACENGKISLDDSFKRVLPDFSVKSRDGVDYSDKITFRHLLKHRSGLAAEFPVGNYVDAYYPTELRINSVKETYLKFVPDTDYSYSNMGFDLVAYALEKIFDMDFKEYMKKYVFEPLDMSESTFDSSIILTDYKSAIGHNHMPLVKFPENPYGSGGMYATAEDMAKFVMCFCNMGSNKGKKIIKSGTLKSMYVEYPITDQWKYHIGMDVGLIGDHVCINHNGSGYGFLTTQDIYPNEKMGFITLSNSTNHPFVQHSISRMIATDLFGLKQAGLQDCKPLENSDSEKIGLYGIDNIILADDGNKKTAITPRNGALYYNNKKLTRYNSNTYFTDNNDCIEFYESGVKINYWRYHKINE